CCENWTVLKLVVAFCQQSQITRHSRGQFGNLDCYGVDFPVVYLLHLYVPYTGPRPEWKKMAVGSGGPHLDKFLGGAVPHKVGSSPLNHLKILSTHYFVEVRSDPEHMAHLFYEF